MTPDGIKRLMLDEGTGPTTNAFGSNRMLPYWDASGEAIDFNPASMCGWPTIGFGRNLGSNGIRFSEAKLMLENDLVVNEASIASVAPFHTTISPVWSDVLEMIQYNTGNLAAWPHLLLAMRNGNTNAVVAEIQDSKSFRGVQANRYGRFCEAVLYRRWLFSAADDAAYNKMVASTPLTS